MDTHSTDQIIVFKVYNDFADAGFAKAKLEEEGIESFLEDRDVAGLNPLGGIELKIFLTDKEKAEQILSKEN